MASYDDRYRRDDDHWGEESRSRDHEAYRRGGYSNEWRRNFTGEGYGRRDQGYGDRDDHGRGGRDYGDTDYARGMREDMRSFAGRGGADRERSYGRERRDEGRYGRGYSDDGDTHGWFGSHDDDRRGFGSSARGYRSSSMTRTYGDQTAGAYGSQRGGPNYSGGMGADDDRFYGHSSYRTTSGGQYSRGGLGARDEDRGFFSRAGDEIASWFGSEEAERRREADARQGDAGAQHHVGRGPKNYQRSDSRIEEDINDQLTADRYLDASEISVSVSGGEVTLTGTVRTRACKRRAEDIADDVSGVRHVQNNLRVQERMGAMGQASSFGDTGTRMSNTGDPSSSRAAAGTSSTGVSSNGSSNPAGSTAISGTTTRSDRT